MSEELNEGGVAGDGRFDRRDVLKSTLAAGLLGGSAASASGTAAGAPGGTPDWADDRLQRALKLRNRLAARNLGGSDGPGPGEHPTSGDEERYDDYVASFTKGLPHDEHGRVASTDNYERLVAALNSAAGNGDYEAVEMGGERKLVTPGGAASFALSGLDPNDADMAAPPAFGSAEMAAETVELYWRARLRDVPFAEYEWAAEAERAAAELDSLSGYTGPTNDGGTVDASVLFRGNAAGARTGPFVSQFLYKEIPRGNVFDDQALAPYRPGVDYVTDYDDWLTVQNGNVPDLSGDDGGGGGRGGNGRGGNGAAGTLNVGANGRGLGLAADVGVGVGSGGSDDDRRLDEKRYVRTGRDLATYVHGNAPDQSFRNAALILLGAGVPLDPDNPLADSGVQAPFVDYGPADVVSAVAGVVNPALNAAWHHKWRVHRKLRPETFGGRIHDHLTDGPDYPAIHDDVLDSEAVRATYEDTGTYLLPQAYPEGSPTHPSYPAGHAVIAGACATVLKAYFDDRATVPDPVEPDPWTDGTELRSIDADLTVAGEVNKLASNDALGRDFAGIHYRSDGSFETDEGLDGGMVLGERVAHAWLRDRIAACARTGPLSYTTLAGDRATIDAN